MKKKLYILLAATALIIATPSCTDFLDEEVKVGDTPSLSYATATGIEGLVAGAYTFSRGWYGKEAGLGLSEMGSDLFYYGYDNKQKSLNSYNITAESLDNNNKDNPSLDHYWELFFSAVDVCNNAIKYTALNEVINDSKRDQYYGEAYFLRAFYYWHMVNIWGPISYNDRAQEEIVYNPERLSEEVVYSKILADLDKSIKAFDNAGYTILDSTSKCNFLEDVRLDNFIQMKGQVPLHLKWIKFPILCPRPKVAKYESFNLRAKIHN